MSPTRAYLGWGSLLYLLRNLICDTRRAGRGRREAAKSFHTVLELGIYVKAEVKGILLNGAEFLSKASNSMLAWIQIPSRRTPPNIFLILKGIPCLHP